ncbi:MAG TPA: sulfate adenylyltransferase subunit CysD [Bacteroidia bacterium]|nr:sulfate adenylyltransferase subunit CysD [Sphingobacteriales bacterium]HPD63915.1 sulfate adenylyltransferase subunit CysD [Bacteroidia bacterium]HRS57724.1 sulfate adenylyltransferase subunit CysD [Bacteroidia bacterium]HRU67061.1 sulfate adenylyltransferase subunit CysD [Bacteroidia bacterium]
MSYTLSHLDHLESEAVFVIREAASVFSKPMLLFSGGKDSMVLLHLAWKAFLPARIPFPIVHIDTGHNFQETLDYRDEMVKKYEVQLVVGYVQDTIDSGKVKDETGVNASRNWLQSVTLLETIENHKFDCAMGGGRRDEEKARAKERFFSHRNEFGEWDPKNQRPELWNLFNGRKNFGEHFRVFPLSNWTEMDVWQYIARENIPMPSLYFSHKRKVFNRDGVWLAVHPVNVMKPNEVAEEKLIRFRTIGDMTCTGAIESEAYSLEDIIREVAAFRVTERAGRADDKRSETAMEDRKKEGYF